jgi:transposase
VITTRIPPQQVSSWIFAHHLLPEHQQVLEQARQMQPDFDLLVGLIQDFLMIVRQRKPQHLRPWIEAVALTPFLALARFAKGLYQDFDAVYSACSSPWSTGQVEGQINRLKLLKRQMYGRANFDLLRLRVLYFSHLHGKCA